MLFRYRVLGFDASLSSDDLLAAIWSKAGAPVHRPGSQQWAEILAHLHVLGAKTLLVQDHVRDADFIDEYEAVYSKQYRDMDRFCVRVHAFSSELPAAHQSEQDVLEFIDSCASQSDAYLGFVTLRPLRNAPIGATILKNRPDVPSLCEDKFPVHIAGTSFEVRGTPYLQQDNAAGACAQASIWMALRTLRRRYGSAAFSPAELTLEATRYTAFNRVFPGRDGLTVAQMLAAIRASGHDPLVIPLREYDPNTGKGYTVPFTVMERVQPYIESGIPVILLLQNPSGGHAVVSIGVAPGASANNNVPPGLLIHNDNQGPYRILPFSDPSGGYALNQCVSALVPLPTGILMPAEDAEKQAHNLLAFWREALVKSPSDRARVAERHLWTRTYLCTRHAFRKWAKTSPTLDPALKQIYRAAGIPRLVWVTEIHDPELFDPSDLSKSSRLGEIVLDAAADALHGDALTFVRVSSRMLSVPAEYEGLLVAPDEVLLPLATSHADTAISEPWDHM